MKSVFLSFVILLIAINSQAQKTEVMLNADGGFFLFHGKSSSPVFDGEHYIFFGKAFIPSYGMSAQLQYIFSSQKIIGLSVGYENLRNENKNFGQLEVFGPLEIFGKSVLSYQFTNIFPYVGYRFNLDEEWKLDVLAGVDIGFMILAIQKENEHNLSGDTMNFTNYLYHPNIDIRPRLQADFFYKRFGFYFGYSFGVVNYAKTNNLTTDKIYSECFRMGISYKIFIKSKHDFYNKIENSIIK